MKYAILQSGGKQYVAREGESLEVDRLPVEKGEAVEFSEVLLVSDGKNIHVGTPRVEGARVKGRVLEEVKARKVVVFKYIPKERYRRKSGHRQRYTRVAIESIVAPEDGKAAEKSTPKAKDKAAEAKAKAAKKASEPKPKAEKKPGSSKPKAEKGKAATKKTGAKAGTAKRSSASAKKTSKSSEKKGGKSASSSKKKSQ